MKENEIPARTLEEEAHRAIVGDREGLETLVRALQGDIYGLALRMLCNREDAEDATQEILVRIVTRLSQFDFRSRLKTWAFRVAVNYILDAKKSAKVQCPALAIHGELDEYGSVEFPRRIVSGIKARAEMMILKGCGHVPHRERKEEVLNLTAAFLEPLTK